MKRVNRNTLLLGIILFAGLLVRVWGVAYDLPSIYHPDEPNYVTIVQTIFKTGDLNPHFFNYPSLFFYINALAYIPYFLVGKLFGIFAARADILPPVALVMGVAQSPMPTTVLLGRAISIAFGVATIGLIYLIGRRLTGRASVGLLAALFMAVSPSNVSNSRLMTPDTLVVFFTAASFLAAVLVYQQGKTWQYVLAGICIGLTASSKYNGGLIVLTLLVAHFLRYGLRGFKERNLYLALLLCGVGFLATTPFALLDFPKFLADLRFESQHYQTGHPGLEGDTLAWYLAYMWRTAGLVYLLAVLGVVRGIFARSKEAVLLIAFPAVYFAFINSFVVRNDRTFLPLTPFLFLLAAWFVVCLFDRISTLRSPALRPWLTAGAASLAIASLILPVSATFASAIRQTTVNNREVARAWIAGNLPAGSKVVIEPYAPYVDPSRFMLTTVPRMIDHEPQWYIDQGFDYLVFSQGMYGRFYQEPSRYQTETSLYDALFASLRLVKLFEDDSYEVRVYSPR